MTELKNTNTNTNSENNNIETENAQGQDITETDAPRTYTEEELQSLVDKRVTQALATAQRKNEAKLREAEKLAQMSATEKYEYQLNQREAAIAEKEKQLLLAENKNEAAKILADRGLSLDFVDYVVGDGSDAEEMSNRIKGLERAFRKSVSAEVTKRLSTPSLKDSASHDAMTRDKFQALSLFERQAIYESDKDLYDTLSK